MSQNRLQIKRSTSNAVVTGLANGELAFTQASNTLFIGLPDGSGVAAIGGVRYPGTLTANQALVANSTSAIDKVIVANAVVTYLTANGALGAAGKILASNATGGIYWMDAGATGTNTDAQYTWSNTQTFSNTITFSSTINGTANNSLYLGGTAAAGYQTTAGLSANVATLTANAAGYLNSKTESNLNVNSASSAAAANNASYLGGTAASGYQTTAGLSANVATLAANSATYLDGNTASDLRTYSETTAGNAYTWAMANTLSRNGSYTGNNTLGGTNTIISSNLSITGSILADIVPTGNGTINLGSALNRFGTIYLAGSTISLGNTTLSDNATGGLTVGDANITGTFTSSGNTKLGDATSDVISFGGRVNTAIVPSANITYNLGTIDLRYDKVFSSNVVSEYANIGKDLTVSGNLYVTGTVAYINTTSFSTTDTLIQLASNNNVTDILDIGFFGEYTESSTVKYTGLFRDASDGRYSLFTGLTDAPAGTVNTAATSFAYGTLSSYLNSSALVANATQTNITANSTVSVAITANTLNFDSIDSGTF